METKDFTFEGAGRGSSGCGGCGLSHIPSDVWKILLRIPFRRRHPVIFWGAWIAVVFLILCIIVALVNDEDAMPMEEGIALVEVKGSISTNMRLLGWIDRISRSDKIKGVLLRVDSPGGGAAASQELYLALRNLASKKPLYVSMGSMAASGGLMVSMAGERIFASGSTVTGSIGVRMDIPQLGVLLDRIGVGQQTLTTAPMKDAGSMLRPLSKEEREYFQGVLEDMHGQFVDIVAEGRHMAREQAVALASGRIFTGREALANGLIDELGGFSDAHARLCEKTGVARAKKLVRMPEKTGSWLQKQMGGAVGFALEAVGGLRDQMPLFLYR